MNVTRKELGAPLILPQSLVPPKGSELQSAFKLLDEEMKDDLDQMRAQIGRQQSGAEIERLDIAICMLVLDFGYTGEELRECLEISIQEILREAEVLSKGA